VKNVKAIKLTSHKFITTKLASAQVWFVKSELN